MSSAYSSNHYYAIFNSILTIQLLEAVLWWQIFVLTTRYKHNMGAFQLHITHSNCGNHII